MRQLFLSFLVVAVIVPARKIYRKRRLLHRLHASFRSDVEDNQIGSAANKAKRIARVKYLK